MTGGVYLVCTPQPIPTLAPTRRFMEPVFFYLFWRSRVTIIGIGVMPPLLYVLSGMGFVHSNSPNDTAETMGVKESLCKKKKGRRRRRLIIIKPLFPFPIASA